MLRRDLLARGWTDNGLAAMVRQGAWAKPRYGAYVDAHDWRAADGPGRHEITARAVLAQAKTNVVLSHLSAAAVWDLSFWDLDLGKVHVTRRDGRCGRTEAGVNQHHGALLPEDVTVRHRLPVVSATRLALELSTVTGLEHSLAFTNELLHRGETTHEQLWDRYRSMTRWPHSLTTEVMLRLSTAKLESAGEHRTSYLFYKQQLPQPEYQHEIRDHRGNVVAIVDFAWPELGTFVEFDGKAKYTKHLKPGQTPADAIVAEKRREDLIRELTGWTCIRLVWADLYLPEATALRIRRAMDRRALRAA